MRTKSLVLAGIALVGGLSAAPALAQSSGTGGNNTVSLSPQTTVLSDLLDFVTTSNSTTTSIDSSQRTRSSNDDSFNTRNANNNVRISADQSLRAVNSNRDMDHLMDLNGGQLLGLGGAVGYASGANNVSGNAYAAFAGIDSAAWNTGLNSNAQAASNIGAQGSITFSN